ncbi:hypothetical protein V6N13_075756 [Hibiscus sabdariffa]|uniref:Uncharacterized protein n=1 Tax=Hibiscus sabdariffa TaxID=183260 RepID=A0ABR2UD62_9ROSI
MKLLNLSSYSLAQSTDKPSFSCDSSGPLTKTTLPINPRFKPSSPSSHYIRKYLDLLRQLRPFHGSASPTTTMSGDSRPYIMANINQGIRFNGTIQSVTSFYTTTRLHLILIYATALTRQVLFYLSALMSTPKVIEFRDIPSF